MKAAQTVQSLVLKPADWEPEPDDHEIERSSNYYLTGVCNGMFGREAPTPSLPVRHGKLAIEPKCPFLEVCFLYPIENSQLRIYRPDGIQAMGYLFIHGALACSSNSAASDSIISLLMSLSGCS
jgi:hypothetical protein